MRAVAISHADKIKTVDDEAPEPLDERSSFDSAYGSSSRMASSSMSTSWTPAPCWPVLLGALAIVLGSGGGFSSITVSMEGSAGAAPSDDGAAVVAAACAATCSGSGRCRYNRNCALPLPCMGFCGTAGALAAAAPPAADAGWQNRVCFL